MAGMLPGVEAARRRRFHNSNLNHGPEIYPTTSGHGSSSTRRSSFCLYAVSSHEIHSTSSGRNPAVSSQQGLCDESRLCAAAREAKKRLDDRLQPQRTSETKRMKSTTTPCDQQRSRFLVGRMTAAPPQLDLQAAQVPKLKKLKWLKLRWKSSQREECAVCLETLKAGRGETVMQLPCGHRFHTKCLMPWLEGNAHCPCCRMEIPSLK